MKVGPFAVVLDNSPDRKDIVRALSSVRGDKQIFWTESTAQARMGGLSGG